MKRLVAALVIAVFAVSCSPEKEVAYDASTLDELNGKTVSLLLGSIYDVAFSGSGMNIMRMNCTAEVFTALQSGASDYALTSSTHTVGVNLAEMGLKINFEGFTGTEVACAFRKSDVELCGQFNQFLAEIKQNGKYDEIIARWTTGDVQSHVMPSYNLPKGGTVLNIGSINTNYPFTFISHGELVGIEPEIMYCFSEWSGIPVYFMDVDFAAAITGLVTGKIDVIAETMSITDERAKSVLFSDPYFYAQGQCLSRLETAAEEDISLFGTLKESFVNNLLVEKRWSLLIDGLLTTVLMSFLVVLFGTLLAVPVCLMLGSSKKFWQVFVRIYGKIMEGIPLLVILMVLFYVVFASSSISPLWVGVIAFSLFFANSAGNLFNTSLSQIPSGQWEAGRALGFSSLKTFFLIVAPQALKIAVPLYKSTISNIIKETSIVGYIAIQDLTKVSDILRSRTFDAFFPLVIITVLYFVIVWIFAKLVDLLFVRK